MLRFLILLVAIVATPATASADWDWRKVFDTGISPPAKPRPVWQRKDDSGISPPARKAPEWVQLDEGLLGPSAAQEPIVAPQWMKDLAKERGD